MSVKTTNFEWVMPSQGDDPWTTVFHALVGEIDAELLNAQVPTGKTMKWGDDVNGHTFSVQPGTGGIKYNGTHDRQDLPVKNLQVENVGALPAAGASVLGKIVFFQEKFWVCVDAATPVYYPLTRQGLVVNPDASRKDAEYNSIATALAALPAAGGTVYLMPGTYTLGNALTPPSNCRIIGLGDDVVIDYSVVAEAYGVLLQDKTDVLIQGCRFQGGAAKNGVRVIATANGLAARITIRDCRFLGGVNAVEFLKSAGTGFFIDDVRVEGCEFTGEAGSVSESGVYHESLARRLWVSGCFFTGWGRADAQHACMLNLAVGSSRWLRVSGCSFEANGSHASTEEHDLNIENASDVVVQGCTSDAAGGTAFRADTCTRFVIDGCTAQGAAGDGFVFEDVTDSVANNCVADAVTGNGFVTTGTLNRMGIHNCYAAACTGKGFDLDQLDDSAVIGCVSRGNTGDGFEVSTCDKTLFSGCRADGNTVDGFDLVSGTYLTFMGCVSRNNTAEDLKGSGAGITNCRLNFVLSKVPGGTYDASNGIKRSYYLSIGGGQAIAGTPVFGQISTFKHAGWAFDGAAAEEVQFPEWFVPERVLPGAPIDARVHYAGNNAPGAGDDSVSFTVIIYSVNPGTTLLDDAPGASVLVSGQLVNAIKQFERSAAGAVASSIWSAAERNLRINLERTVADAGDDYAHDVYVTAVELEVTEAEIEVRA